MYMMFSTSLKGKAAVSGLKAVDWGGGGGGRIGSEEDVHESSRW